MLNDTFSVVFKHRDLIETVMYKYAIEFLISGLAFQLVSA